MSLKTVSLTSTMGATYRIETALRGHRVIVDQMPSGGGKDEGPSPLEYLFVSLAGCIGTIGRLVANQRRLPLRGMAIAVEGDVDVDKLLGKPTDARAGFQQIRVNVQIDADMTLAEKRAFLAEVDKRCPVSENLLKGTALTFSVTE